MSDWDCGPATMYLLGKIEGIGITEKDIVEAVRPNALWGTSHEEMQTIARGMGFAPVTYENATVEFIEKQKENGADVVVDWMSGEDEENDGHYSLVDHVDDKEIVLNDTLAGAFVKIPHNEFQKIWWDTDLDEKPVRGWCMILLKDGNL